MKKCINVQKKPYDVLFFMRYQTKTVINCFKILSDSGLQTDRDDKERGRMERRWRRKEKVKEVAIQPPTTLIF